MKKLVITAGHSLSDSGAINTELNVKESDLTIKLRDGIIKSILSKEKGAGIPVQRDFDNQSLKEVIRNIETTPETICVDIHFNAVPNKNVMGSEVVIPDNHTKDEMDFGTEVAYCLGTYFKNRGVKTESQTARKTIGILRQEQGINILIETCFISNNNDVRIFNTKFDEICDKLADIFISWFWKY